MATTDFNLKMVELQALFHKAVSRDGKVVGAKLNANFLKVPSPMKTIQDANREVILEIQSYGHMGLTPQVVQLIREQYLKTFGGVSDTKEFEMLTNLVNLPTTYGLGDDVDIEVPLAMASAYVVENLRGTWERHPLIYRWNDFFTVYENMGIDQSLANVTWKLMETMVDILHKGLIH